MPMIKKLGEIRDLTNEGRWSNFFGSSNLRLPEILQQRVSQAQQKSFTFVTIKLLVATVAL